MSPRNQGSGQPQVLPDRQAAASPSEWGGSGQYLFVTGGEPSIDHPHLRETTSLQFMYTRSSCFYRRENGITAVFMFVRFLGFDEEPSSCSGLAHNHVPKCCTSHLDWKALTNPHFHPLPIPERLLAGVWCGCPRAQNCMQICLPTKSPNIHRVQKIKRVTILV